VGRNSGDARGNVGGESLFVWIVPISRKVVLSAASFLIVPEIVSQSDFVALVPERLVRHRANKLKLIDSPFPVQGFEVGVVWHERSHGHSGQRWIREAIDAAIV
jgi:DNA-binding transcriptional LysR family regulator